MSFSLCVESISLLPSAHLLLPPGRRRGYPTASVMLQGSGASTEPPPHPLSSASVAETASRQLPECCLIFETYPILITIQRRSSAGAGHWLGSQSLPLPRLSAAACLEFPRPLSQPASQTWPRAAQKEEERRKKRRFSIDWAAFYKHHIK